jgi:hypothetical protein
MHVLTATTTFEWLTLLLSAISTIGLLVSLFFVAQSNRKLAASMRMQTLQSMVSEMNTIRQMRSNDPSLERELFTNRAGWTDSEIKKNLFAVELANIFEWAYLARKNDLLEKEIWDSWVETWVGLLKASKPLADSFSENVWTFGRSPEMRQALDALVRGEGVVKDPRSSSSA